MKRIGLILMAIVLVAFPMYSQTVGIPDTAFLHALIEEGVDTDDDGQISYAEAEKVISLDISSALYYCGSQGVAYCPIRVCTGNIQSLEGIQKFKNLVSLNCSGNRIRSLDLSGNTDLMYLDCSGNGSHHEEGLDSLIISQCESLENLNCSHSFLHNIDISGNKKIDTLILIGLHLNHDKTDQEQDVYPVYVWETFFTDAVYIDKEIHWIYREGWEEDIISPIQFIIKNTVSIEDVHSPEIGLSIYPNPTNSLLTIETDHPDHYSVNLNSLNGQLIYSTTMEGTSQQIDLTSFQKGVYFITIRSDELVTTRKVIKL